MKTNEQELALLGLQEINESERKEVKGGVLYPFDINFDINDYIIFCCINIPPDSLSPLKDYIF